GESPSTSAACIQPKARASTSTQRARHSASTRAGPTRSTSSSPNGTRAPPRFTWRRPWPIGTRVTERTRLLERDVVDRDVEILASLADAEHDRCRVLGNAEARHRRLTRANAERRRHELREHDRHRRERAGQRELLAEPRPVLGHRRLERRDLEKEHG